MATRKNWDPSELLVVLDLKGFFVLSFCLLGPHWWHMEVPRLGVESELLLLAYATATAMWDLSRVCDLHDNSWQHWIHNPLSKTRDQTHILMGASRVRYH